MCSEASYAKVYDWNRYNDLSVTRYHLEILQGIGRTQEIRTRRSEYENLMNDYHLAIMNNAHFIALSHNPEQLVVLADMFAKLFPDAEPQYLVMGSKITRKAEEERERLQHRGGGYLW